MVTAWRQYWTGRERRLARRRYASPTVGFAWLRLLCALAVVLDHSVPLTGVNQAPLLPVSWNFSLGYLALLAFFAMSGYQISQSWDRDPSWIRFSAKRLLRLLPPLIVVLLITVLVIGPLVTTAPLSEYWKAAQTWRYLVGNTVLVLIQHILPGVF
ncbi:MAG: acyltransferase family protein, partial [Sciscionella sp.]